MEFQDAYKAIPTHYEYMMPGALNSELMILRAQVFRAMQELDGWCPKEKAFILVDLILHLKPKVVVEIGVFGGKSLIPMAYALKFNDQGKIYGIDPWDAKASSEGMDGVNLEWWSSVDHELILKKLENKIAQLKLQSHIELLRFSSEDCPPISNIDILHIDGNHSEKTSYIDVIKWLPLVESGGIIIFDDVNWVTTRTATKMLDESCIKIAEYKGDNIWGIWVKP